MKLAALAISIVAVLMLLVGVVTCIIQNGALLKHGPREFLIGIALTTAGVGVALCLAAFGYWIGGCIIKP